MPNVYRLRISTKSKIQLAKNGFHLAKLYNKLIGKDYRNIQCRKKGIQWQLDLEEGIDFYIYLFGRYEVSSYKAMKNLLQPGDITLDIGANIGAHTLPMAELVGKSGKVIAIEATNWAYQKLLRNLSLNEDLKDSVTPVQSLLNETSNQADAPHALYSSWSFDEKKEKHKILRGSLNSTSEAKVLALDDLVNSLKLEKLDFIKMDVDGFECKVLRGSDYTIKHYKPSMLIEISPFLLREREGSLEEYLDFLIQNGYKIYEESSRKLLSMNPKELNQYIPADGAINAIALA